MLLTWLLVNRWCRAEYSWCRADMRMLCLPPAHPALQAAFHASRSTVTVRCALCSGETSQPAAQLTSGPLLTTVLLLPADIINTTAAINARSQLTSMCRCPISVGRSRPTTGMGCAALYLHKLWHCKE